MLILLIGRTGTGKSTVVKCLKSFKPIVSYCDREPRNDETEGVEHYFISKDKFTELMTTKEVCAYTRIADTRYMSLVEQITDNCVYVIDPIGFKKIKRLGIPYLSIYLWASKAVRENRTKDRSYNFEERHNSENEQFTEFEKKHSYDLWYNTELLSPEEIADLIEMESRTYNH